MNGQSNEQLLTLTRKMLASAEACDWDKLAELEKTRLPIFHQVFDEGVEGKVELAQEILQLDEITKSLAEAGLPDLQNEILTAKKSGKANDTYQTIQNYGSGDDK